MKTIPLSDPVLGNRELQRLQECIQSGFVSSVGPLVQEFERAFAAKVGTRFAVATASGTAALHVSLRALGLKPGEAVIVPDLTFVASVNPALYCGAQPVLVDVHPETWCLDPQLFRDVCQILRRERCELKAVIPVHLYGTCCDMTEIVEIASEYGLHVVEDATEALGATWRGRAAGTWGDLGCFSFNGNKLITTGAGGMVVTDSPALAEKVRYLVSQARDSANSYRHSEMGYNYRLSNLAAALGLAQLERLDDLLRAKRAIAQCYRCALQNLPALQTHPEPAGMVSSFWLYSIVLANPSLRDGWIKALNDSGIMARKFFTPLHRQPYLDRPLWRSSRHGPELAAAGHSDLLAAAGINLPCSANLCAEDQKAVIDKIRALAARATPDFSNPWKKRGRIFQPLEKTAPATL